MARRPVETPLGAMAVSVTGDGVVAASFPRSVPLGWLPQVGDADAERMADRAEEELEEFFEGRRRVFTVPVDWSHAVGGFAGEVLREVARIPFGETARYGEIAERTGHPRAARAVGTACGKNECSMFVPCHRVVAAGGIGGYGGGEWMKRALLAFEAGDANAWRFVRG